jgi:hypothetical protein
MTNSLFRKKKRRVVREVSTVFAGEVTLRV